MLSPACGPSFGGLEHSQITFFPVSVGTQGSLLAFGPLGGVRGGRSAGPKGPAVYLLVFYGVFCIYASKTRVFLPRGFKILVFYGAFCMVCLKNMSVFVPRLQNPCILHVFCMVCLKNTSVFRCKRRKCSKMCAFLGHHAIRLDWVIASAPIAADSQHKVVLDLDHP